MADQATPKIEVLPNDLRAVFVELRRIADTLNQAAVSDAADAVPYTRMIARMAVVRMVLMRYNANVMKAGTQIMYELGERLLDPVYNIQDHHDWFVERSGLPIVRSSFYRFVRRFDLTADAVMRGVPLKEKYSSTSIPDWAKDRSRKGIGKGSGKRK